MTRTTLAVAADYADALMTARRSKNWLFLLLLIMMLAQIGLFLAVRYNAIKLTTPASIVETPSKAGEILQYIIPVIEFLGVTLALVLSVVLLLLTGIMVVGRLIGVSHLTSAFIWSILLVVFLFPWQAFLISSDGRLAPTVQSSSVVVTPQPAFKVPGVLYTYPELVADHDFPNHPWPQAVLKWARYIGFPVLALIVLLSLQARSSRGLKMALGEADIHVEMASSRGVDPMA